MTKPTITDEDRALFVALMGYDSETIDAILGGNAFTWEVEQIAAYRQAAFNAGLERAAELVVGYIHPDPDRLPGELFASAAIRAEKEKPQ